MATQPTSATSQTHVDASGSRGLGAGPPLVVDRSFQFSILRRVSMYGLLGAFYVGGISVATDCMADPLASWRTVLMNCLDETVYFIPGLLVIVPLVTINVLRMTRRFALPINRLSKEMQLLSDGLSESPLTEDPNEPWSHLVTQFNELREELLELRQASVMPPTSSVPTAGRATMEPLPEIEIPDLSKELANAML